MTEQNLNCARTCIVISEERTKHQTEQRTLEESIKTQINWLMLLVWQNNQTLNDELSSTSNTTDLQKLVNHLVWVITTQVQANKVIIDESSKIIQWLEEQSEKLKTDNLTWLYNRHKFDEVYQPLSEKWKVFSLWIIDIDKFKNINDTYWHLCWDEVLQFLSQHLVTQFWRETVFRFWGEEFVILFLWKAEKLHDILENFLATITKVRLTYKDVNKFSISFTWGVSQFSPWKSFETLFREADALLYKGKETGRSKILID